MKTTLRKVGKKWVVRAWETRPFHETEFEEVLFCASNKSLGVLLTEIQHFLNDYKTAKAIIDAAVEA